MNIVYSEQKRQAGGRNSLSVIMEDIVASHGYMHVCYYDIMCTKY